MPEDEGQDGGWLIGVTRVKVAALAFGFSDFAVDFFCFFTGSSSDALWCALSLTSSSSSFGLRRFGICAEAGGGVDQTRGNIARRRQGSSDLGKVFRHARRPPIDIHRVSLWSLAYYFNTQVRVFPLVGGRMKIQNKSKKVLPPVRYSTFPPRQGI